MAGTTLRIDVLGPLRVRRDGRPVAVASSRQRAVLVRLLVDAARPVSADALVEAAWGRSEQPKRPVGALQTVVSRLRRALAPEATIELTPAGYILDGAEIDARRFDDLVTAATATGDLSWEMQVLDQAVGLWRGRAYEGFDVAAVEAEIARLEDDRVGATERLAELLVATGSARSAVSLLRDVVRGHPFREGAHAGLMVALHHAGRTAEALDCYHDYRELLVRELGLDPSPSLVELHRQILSNDLDLGTSGDRNCDRAAGAIPPVAGLLAPSALPLVGRADDIATLTSRVRARRLITVVGTGGVGKTRLAAEVLPGLARELGDRLLAVDCDRLADVRGLRAAVATTARVAPSGLDLDRRLATALDRVPTMLLLDGCEDVRVAVGELVADLLATTASLRVVATTRVPLGSAYEHVVPLAPLAVDQEPEPGDAGVHALFEAAAQRVRPDVEFSADDRPLVADICRRLDGLPLAIELAAARTATVGLTSVRDGLERGTDAVDRATDSPRRSLRSIVEWTCNALSRDAAALLARLAVAPGPVDLALATAVARPAAGGPVCSAFDELVHASLLVPTGDSRRSPLYRMLDFVRRFALSQLTARQRTRAQHALIDWALGLVTDAIPCALGPDDRLTLDRVEAHTANLDLALRLAHRHRRTDADVLAGRLALVSSHRLPFALAHLIHTVGHPGADAEDRPSPLAVAAAARAATLMGDHPTGLGLAQRAWQAGADDCDVRYLAAHTLAIASLYGGDHAPAADWCRQITACEHAPAAHLADAHATLALTAAYGDDLITARHEAETAQAFAAASGASAYRAFAAYAAGEVALREADAVRARESLRRASRAAVDAGAPFVAALADTALGSLLVRDQQTDAAAGMLCQALAYWREAGVRPQIWTTVRLIAEVCITRGDHETALVLFEAARRDPSAPEVTGSDADREAAIVGVARAHIDDEAFTRVGELAGRLTRATIVERASQAVTGVPEARR